MVPPRQLHQPLQSKHAQHGVAFGVQLRPPDRHRAHTGDDGDNAAAYAGFDGQADAVGQVASGVVGATGQQQGVDAAGGVGAEELLASVRQPVNILPAIGQKHGGLGELGAAHLDGALAAVVVQHQLGRVDEVAVAFHEIGHRHVAVRGVALGLGGLGVPVQLGRIAQAAQRTQAGRCPDAHSGWSKYR